MKAALLMFANDSLEKAQNKMQEYRENGVCLGWLIEPKTQRVEIYRSQAVEVLESPSTLSGEDILPEFVLDLPDIF